jgi:hypothetical protein
VPLPGLISILVAAVAGAPATGSQPAPTAHAARSCHAVVDRGVIPAWARTGFSDPEPRMPHVLGRHGRIVAILFGDPLVAPPARDRSNKILWVSHKRQQDPTTLRIRASRPGHRTLTRSVPGGPGPSLIDLPAGCWHLHLRWADQRDRMDLRYARG